jgi:hypothetical protein
VAETRRILDQLNSLNIEIKGLICNDRMQEGPKEKNIENEFSSIPIQHIPYSSSSLIGIAALKHHISSYDLKFDKVFKSHS